MVPLASVALVLLLHHVVPAAAAGSISCDGAVWSRNANLGNASVWHYERRGCASDFAHRTYVVQLVPPDDAYAAPGSPVQRLIFTFADSTLSNVGMTVEAPGLQSPGIAIEIHVVGNNFTGSLVHFHLGRFRDDDDLRVVVHGNTFSGGMRSDVASNWPITDPTSSAQFNGLCVLGLAFVTAAPPTIVNVTRNSFFVDSASTGPRRAICGITTTDVSAVGFRQFRIEGNNVSMPHHSHAAVDLRGPKRVAGGAVYSVSGNRLAAGNGVLFRGPIAVRGPGSVLLVAVNWIRSITHTVNASHCDDSPNLAGGTTQGFHTAGAPVTASQGGRFVIMGNDMVVHGYATWHYHDASVLSDAGGILIVENRLWSWRTDTGWAIGLGYTGGAPTTRHGGSYTVAANSIAAATNQSGNADAVLFQAHYTVTQEVALTAFVFNRISSDVGFCWGMSGKLSITCSSSNTSTFALSDTAFDCPMIVESLEATGPTRTDCNVRESRNATPTQPVPARDLGGFGTNTGNAATTPTSEQCQGSPWSAASDAQPSPCTIESRVDWTAGPSNVTSDAWWRCVTRCGWRRGLVRPWAFLRNVTRPDHRRSVCTDDFDTLAFFAAVVAGPSRVDAADVDGCELALRPYRQIASEALRWTVLGGGQRGAGQEAATATVTASRGTLSRPTATRTNARAATSTPHTASLSPLAAGTSSKSLRRHGSVTATAPPPTSRPATATLADEGLPLPPDNRMASNTTAVVVAEDSALRNLRVDSVSVAGTTAVAVALFARPGVASRASQLRSLSALARCGRPLEEPEFFDHPLQVEAVTRIFDDADDDDEPVADVAGALLVTQLLVVIVCGPVTVVLLWLLLRADVVVPRIAEALVGCAADGDGDSDDHEQSSAAHTQRTPARRHVVVIGGSVAATYFVPVLAGSSAALLYRGAHVWLPLTALVCACGVPTVTLTWGAWKHSGVAAQDNAASPTAQQLLRQLVSLYTDGTRAPAMSTTDGGGSWQRDAVRMLFIADHVVATLFGFATGLQPYSTEATTVCNVVVIVAIVLALALLGYAAVLRPYDSAVENGFFVSGAAVQLASAVALLLPRIGLASEDAAADWFDVAALMLAGMVVAQAVTVLALEWRGRFVGDGGGDGEGSSSVWDRRTGEGGEAAKEVPLLATVPTKTGQPLHAANTNVVPAEGRARRNPLGRPVAGGGS